jgi:hypothetical protein
VKLGFKICGEKEKFRERKSKKWGVSLERMVEIKFFGEYGPTSHEI